MPVLRACVVPGILGFPGHMTQGRTKTLWISASCAHFRNSKCIKKASSHHPHYLPPIFSLAYQIGILTMILLIASTDAAMKWTLTMMRTIWAIYS
eukprot:6181147-Ditylum_brightwellii.AAC.1